MLSKNWTHQENFEESDHDALMQQKHDKITPENQRINDRTTSTADCNIVVESQKKISAMFAKYRKRDFILAEGTRIPEGYDEFKM